MPNITRSSIASILAASHLLLHAGLAGAAVRDELPVVEVTTDNVEITESCQIMVPRGTKLHDADGNGIVHIVADGVTVTMAEGSDWLMGRDWSQAPDRRSGTAVRVDGRSDVTLSGLRIRGFGTGVVSNDASSLVIEGVEIRDGFGLPLGGSAIETVDRPSAEVGGVAIMLEGASNPVVRGSKIRSFQRGVVAVRSSSVEIYDNDVSYLSAVGVHLAQSPDAIISGNVIDGIYGGEGASVSAVLIESGSDRAVVQSNALRGTSPAGVGIVVEASADVVVGANVLAEGGQAIRLIEAADGLVAANEITEMERLGIEAVGGERVVVAANSIMETPLGVVAQGSEVTVREQSISEAEVGVRVTGGSVLVAKNSFSEVDLGVHAAGGTASLGANTFSETEEHSKADGGETEEVAVTMEIFQWEPRDVPGRDDAAQSDPMVDFSGRRPAGDFFAWDGESVTLRTIDNAGKRHIFEVYGGSEHLWAALRGNEASLEWDEANSPSDPVRFSVNGPSGVHPYEVRIAENNKLDRRISGTLLRARWRVDAFEWETDPSVDRDAWREEALGTRGRRARPNAMQFDFGDGGPSDLSMSAAVIRAKLRADQFGIIATSKLPLATGSYAFTLTIGPDDEAVMTVDDEVVIDLDTSGQGTGASEQVVIEIEQSRDVDVRIEYVERSGPAKLELMIGRPDDADTLD